MDILVSAAEPPGPDRAGDRRRPQVHGRGFVAEMEAPEGGSA